MKVFLDMDGVLCDFVSPAMRAHGHKFNPVQWPKGEWDIAKVLGISTKEFWSKIDSIGEVFWSTLRLYDHSYELLRTIENIHGTPTILSAPSQSPHSFSGKRRWLIRHNMGDFPTVFTNQKHLLAGPDRILIDDNDTNCERFEAAGGRAILVPQPWNAKGQSEDVALHVMEALA